MKIRALIAALAIAALAAPLAAPLALANDAHHPEKKAKKVKSKAPAKKKTSALIVYSNYTGSPALLEIDLTPFASIS